MTVPTRPPAAVRISAIFVFLCACGDAGLKTVSASFQGYGETLQHLYVDLEGESSVRKHFVRKSGPQMDSIPNLPEGTYVLAISGTTAANKILFELEQDLELQEGQTVELEIRP